MHGLQVHICMPSTDVTVNVLYRMECDQLRYEGALAMNWPRCPPPLMPPRPGLFTPGPRPMPFGPQRPPVVNFVFGSWDFPTRDFVAFLSHFICSF